MNADWLAGVEYGVRAAERGWNLQRALYEAQRPLVQSLESLNAEIDSFPSKTTPCEGSEYPWIHKPERITDGISKIPGLRCACGKVFDGKEWQAPTNQPAPALWSALQAFKAHFEEVSTASALIAWSGNTGSRI